LRLGPGSTRADSDKDRRQIMNLVYYVVITVHVLSCLFLIAVVLLQQGKGQDLASAFGGGGTQTAFGPRGSATVLSRATTILAGVFMVTSLSLSVLRPTRSSVLDQVPRATEAPAPAATPAAPSAATPAPPGGTPAPAEAPAPTAPAAPKK
jgi:preprotein translocase subunit SecG